MVENPYYNYITTKIIILVVQFKNEIRIFFFILSLFQFSFEKIGENSKDFETTVETIAGFHLFFVLRPIYTCARLQCRRQFGKCLAAILILDSQIVYSPQSSSNFIFQDGAQTFREKNIQCSLVTKYASTAGYACVTRMNSLENAEHQNKC